MKTSILITSLTLAIGLPATAMAIDAAPGTIFPTSFMTLDTNKNGTSSQREMLNGEDHVIVKQAASDAPGAPGLLASTTGQTYLPAGQADCTAHSPCTSATFTPNGKIETKGTSVTFSQDPQTGNVIGTVKTDKGDMTQIPAHKVSSYDPYNSRGGGGPDNLSF